jgi:hypothetical protein
MPWNSRAFPSQRQPSKRPIALSSVESPATDRHVSLRFSLRHLFWAVTLVSLLLAAIARFPGGYGSIAIILAIAVVALHLLSTAVGTHLREETDKQTGVFRPPATIAPMSDDTTATNAALSSSNSPFHTRGFAMPWLPLLVAGGAILGGCLGIAVLELTIANRSTSAGVLVGAISTAVLGGWFAFLAGCFTSILRQGWRDAVADRK